MNSEARLLQETGLVAAWKTETPPLRATLCTYLLRDGQEVRRMEPRFYAEWVAVHIPLEPDSQFSWADWHFRDVARMRLEAADGP